ncbi:hypothetical protein LCM4576_22340 [Mesorhizobium sp. LCM 4576]|nr:hypothetical protein LCM4576_22340 [Mesorhizobium sp. LCM 4576]
MLVISQRDRKGGLTPDKMWWGAEAADTDPNNLTSNDLGEIMGALGEFFDQYPRRRLPSVFSAQQISGMFDQLVGIAAQSHAHAAAAYRWLNNYWQSNLRDRAFNVARICCQAISRGWNAGLREELTLHEFVTTSFDRRGVRSR